MHRRPVGDARAQHRDRAVHAGIDCDVVRDHFQQYLIAVHHDTMCRAAIRRKEFVGVVAGVICRITVDKRGRACRIKTDLSAFRQRPRNSQLHVVNKTDVARLACCGIARDHGVAGDVERTGLIAAVRSEVGKGAAVGVRGVVAGDRAAGDAYFASAGSLNCRAGLRRVAGHRAVVHIQRCLVPQVDAAADRVERLVSGDRAAVEIEYGAVAFDVCSAAVSCAVVCNGTAVHIHYAGVIHIDAAAAGDRACQLVACDRAAVQDEVTFADADAGSVRIISGHFAAGDFAGTALAAIIDGKRGAAVDADHSARTGSADRMTVQAKVCDPCGSSPCVGKRHVVRQVIVARRRGQTVCAFPRFKGDVVVCVSVRSRFQRRIGVFRVGQGGVVRDELFLRVGQRVVRCSRVVDLRLTRVGVFHRADGVDLFDY